MSASPPRQASRRARIGRGVLVALLGAGAVLGIAAAPAGAAVVCSPGGDNCVVVPDVVQTPLGPATITVTPANVVTVQLNPSNPNVLVFGIPFALPAGPPNLPGYTRTSLATSGGVVTIDTIQVPPGPPARIALPDVAIISIHPPSPCRAARTGTTVVFTPLVPPGPPA